MRRRFYSSLLLFLTLLLVLVDAKERLLVFGGNGYIASYVVAGLVEAGYEVSSNTVPTLAYH